MPEVVVNRDLCKGCELCVGVCPHGVLDMAAELNLRGVHPAVVLLPEACTGCSFCAMICPDLAIEVWK